MPIILQFALVSNLYFISQLLYRKYNGNFLVNLLGKWQESEYSGQSVPVDGLALLCDCTIKLSGYGNQSFPRSRLHCVHSVNPFNRYIPTAVAFGGICIGTAFVIILT
ncbi:hypothetical protein POM88_046725 [Heracleum sosnowskyi]|uniref:Uncharacterized protein n=1 Tax=Heracleum sosnowskyi TaxID=360622 RepID=A0AAD8M6A8_9APIA|nr:hypothetical protein POM88_046725 [Heracleum sosnowskyi]